MSKIVCFNLRDSTLSFLFFFFPNTFSMSKNTSESSVLCSSVSGFGISTVKVLQPLVPHLIFKRVLR